MHQLIVHQMRRDDIDVLAQYVVDGMVAEQTEHTVIELIKGKTMLLKSEQVATGSTNG